MSESWISGNEGPNTWSPIEIVKHLIHGEEVDWMPRAQIILEHGDSFAFEPFDPLAFEGRASSSGKGISELLDTFEELRARNVAELHNMDLYLF